jgi:SAM-dependent methyltransferase
VWGTIRHALARLRPGFRRRQARRAESRVRTREEATRAFDGEHGVDTGGYVPAARLAFDAARRGQATAYEPILPHEFDAMMRAAGEVAAGRTFVDLGCGKGRALLLAAKHPFAAVVGVELSHDLAERARENAVAFLRGWPASPTIRVVTLDAAEFDFPAGPLVVFLFDPFREPVMERVIANLARALESEPRAVTVVYANSRHAALFEEMPFAKRVVHGRPTVDGEPGYERWSIFHFDRAAPSARVE